MRTRGLVIGEVLVAAAAVGIVVVLLLVAGDRQRKAMGLGQSTANLRQFGTAHAQYGNDNAGRVATFSWREGDFGESQYPDLNYYARSFGYEPPSAQAIDIMRRRSGRSMSELPFFSGWNPYILYSHLVLVDYLGGPSPSPWILSPGDKPRQTWRKNNSAPDPTAPGSFRWIHSSSYEFAPAFYGTDFGNTNGTLPTMVQADSYTTYQMVGAFHTVAGKRRYDEVAYPGAKVMMFEQFQRFFGPREAFALYPEARVPALLSDGSVSVRRTGESNLGANPTRPTSALTMSVSYDAGIGAANTWDPKPLYFSSDSLDGRFRWTRYGMRGRDFDGPEVTSLP